MFAGSAAFDLRFRRGWTAIIASTKMLVGFETNLDRSKALALLLVDRLK